MVSAETVRHLRWHAGLEELPDQGQPSIAACTWAASDLGCRLDEAVGDCLTVMAQLNQELNGPRPSDVVGGEDLLPRSLVYAMTEIIRFLREANAHAQAWKVERAWSSVLSGDIDDIVGAVQAEWRARSEQ